MTERRVVIFTGAYNHIADGVSLTLNRLVAYLEDHDTETLVVAPTVDDPPVEHAGTLIPVPSIPVPGRPEYRISVGLTPSARSIIRSFRPNLFHIATPDLVGFQALRLAEREGIPAVASYHTHFSSYLKYYGVGALERLMWKYLAMFYGHCRHVYVPSSSIEDVLHSHGIDRGLRRWARGVDTARFNPSHRSLEWRRERGVEDDAVLVSFIGRLVWEKGLGVFADVIESLQRKGVKHRSMIVGDGPALDELRARLPDTVFTGYLEGKELARAYASSDLFLFPSDTETFGNVTLEAMASGIPTVCADATGSRTLVEHGETGLLVPPGNVKGFEDAVRLLIADDPKRRGMGAEAELRARDYSWSTVLSNMIGYYDEILRPGASHSGDGSAIGFYESAPPTASVHS
ncbi:MAG: glycosyltransferase family 1 protein [Rhodothermales bacterium]